ncbi:hypothetical protein [Hartmannibacter diazotrophicus]|uniref:hypothetical protein n=1 Tax=Hartmannibacter diazotrophicus TaxID=1482074 RepID=UPI000C14BF77|nr:hypothetical protein [Hartmannibacter diazotrophicus]
MSDKAFENAKMKKEQLLARKKVILQEMSEIDDTINRIDRFMKDWQSFAEDSVPDQPISDGGSLMQRTPRTRNPSKEDVAEAAYEIIQERGEPIPRDELFDLLSERGITIQGKDPQMVLSTMLWRMKDVIIRIPNYGYWLRNEPHPEAGYDPSTPYRADDEHSDMVHRDIAGTLPNVDED